MPISNEQTRETSIDRFLKKYDLKFKNRELFNKALCHTSYTNENNIDIVWCPGAFEIPLVVKKCAKTNKYSAIITLGAVIKGSTSHYDYVCAEVSKGVASVGLETGVPVIFGILTTDNIEQAIERAGTKSGNKGSDAARSAIEMVSLINNIN